jgi:hypothetical protein
MLVSVEIFYELLSFDILLLLIDLVLLILSYDKETHFFFRFDFELCLT